MLDLRRGPLVLAHSDHLRRGQPRSGDRVGPCALARGAARRRARAAHLRRRARVLRRRGARRGPSRRSQADDPSRRALRGAGALRRRRAHGRVARRTSPSLRAVARQAPSVRVGFTFPEDRLGVSRRPCSSRSSARGLVAARAFAPRLLPRMVGQGRSERADAPAPARDALGDRAHARDRRSRCWRGRSTSPAELERVVAAGADGVITNDPRLFG